MSVVLNANDKLILQRINCLESGVSQQNSGATGTTTDGIRCDLIFDCESYVPSQTINMRIELFLDESKFITSLAIEIEGVVDTRFSRLRNLVKCRGFSLIFYTKSILVGSEHAIDTRLEAGLQTYNHQIKFPTYLPYSFKNDFCEIKYLAIITITYNQSINTIQKFKTIRMMPYRNLQLEKYLGFESRVDLFRVSKKDKTDLYRISAWMPLSGITSGQQLPLVITITNGNVFFFDFVNVALVQKQIYKSYTPIRSFKYTKKLFKKNTISKFIKVFDGLYTFNCLLDIDKNCEPTISSPRWDTFQNIYEIEIYLEALKLSSKKRYRIKLPHLPVVIGTQPICRWNFEDLAESMNMQKIKNHVSRKKFDFEFSKYLIIQLNLFNSIKE